MNPEVSDPKALSLTELTTELTKIMQKGSECGGELAESEFEWIDKIETELIPKKVDNCHFVLEWMKSQSEFFDAQAEEMRRQSKFYEKATERLKIRIRSAMVDLKTEEINGNCFRFKLVKNPGRLVIENAKLVPDQYVILVKKYDNEKIKSDIKLGFPIDGCRIEEGMSLRSFSAKKEVK